MLASVRVFRSLIFCFDYFFASMQGYFLGPIFRRHTTCLLLRGLISSGSFLADLLLASSTLLLLCRIIFSSICLLLVNLVACTLQISGIDIERASTPDVAKANRNDFLGR